MDGEEDVGMKSLGLCGVYNDLLTGVMGSVLEILLPLPEFGVGT
jgi:hypothetical protein